MRSKDHKVCFFICCFPGHLSGLAEYLSHSLQRSTKGFLQYMDSCFSSNMWIFSPSTGTQNSLPFCLQFQTFCYGGGCDAHLIGENFGLCLSADIDFTRGLVQARTFLAKTGGFCPRGQVLDR